MIKKIKLFVIPFVLILVAIPSVWATWQFASYSPPQKQVDIPATMGT